MGAAVVGFGCPRLVRTNVAGRRRSGTAHNVRAGLPGCLPNNRCGGPGVALWL